jgi:hypothetical protein
VLRQTTPNQTKAYITKSSCKICALAGYYAAQSGNSLLMFLNLSAQSSNVKKSKRENKTSVKLTDKILLFDLKSSNFLKMHNVL